MSISNQFFCNSCKTSNGAPGTTQAACDGLTKIAGTKCLEYNPDGFDSIANEINDVWKTVMPDLKSRNKLNKNHFSDNAGKLMVMGEKEDMIEVLIILIRETSLFFLNYHSSFLNLPFEI